MASQLLSVDGGLTSTKSIITRVMVAKMGNFQFMHTLGDGIFLYVFGDRIGQITLSGLAFDNNCASGNPIGVEQILAYYDANRVAAREQPIRVTIGTGTTFNAYLGQISTQIADPSSRIFTFDMPLILIPDSSS